MASSSQPFLNIKDSSLNADILIFATYNSNMNVEMLQTPDNVASGNVVEDAPNVNAYISKLHLTNLGKQHATYKPYNRNSPMWGFF